MRDHGYLTLLSRQIGEHPFISVRQICRILGMSQSLVYREIGKLREGGWVDRVNPRHPDVRARALYYLTRDGEGHLSFPRREGRPRYLRQIAAVYELRNLFISARRAGLPIARWQVLTPSTLGASLHGAGLTPDGRRLIVEWDRGERPLRSYRHRLRRVARIADRTGAGLLLVAADGVRGTALLCTLFGYVTPRGPHLVMTTRASIVDRGVRDAVCYIPVFTDVISLGGFVETLPQPWGEDLPLSPGVMGFREGWFSHRRLVLDLSPWQKRMLSILAGIPLLSAEGLAALGGREGRAWTARLLVDLRERGLVEEYVPDPHRLHRYHYPTRAGLTFLAEGCGTRTEAYARARGWRIEEDEVSVSHLTRVFQHTRATWEIALAMAREAARRRQTITWYDEKEAYVYFTARGRRRVLAPDARVHWGRRVFFVEVDRGSGRVRALADKIDRYYDFLQCGGYRRFADGRFRLLVVVSSAEREWQWPRVVRRQAGERSAEPLDILIATRRAVQEQGLGAPIWRGLSGDGDRVHFLEQQT